MNLINDAWTPAYTVGGAHRIHRKVELRPEGTDPDHESMCFDTSTDDAEIIGVVIGRALAGVG